MDLATLCNMANSGLYAFLNNVDHRVYISASKNILRALNGHIERFKLGCSDCELLQEDFNNNKLEVVVLETNIEGRVERLLLVEAHKLKYKQQGYSGYNQRRTIDPWVELVTPKTGDYEFKPHVILTTNQTQTVVGIFDSLSEAKEFSQRHYGKLPITSIIYASNPLTLDYLSKIDR